MPVSDLSCHQSCLKKSSAKEVRKSSSSVTTAMGVGGKKLRLKMVDGQEELISAVISRMRESKTLQKSLRKLQPSTNPHQGHYREEGNLFSSAPDCNRL